MKQKCMHEEINSRLNSGNASNNLVQNLLSPACYEGIQNLRLDKNCVMRNVMICTAHQILFE